jgi:hypothetical protein
MMELAQARTVDALNVVLRIAMTISTSWVKRAGELTQDAFRVPLLVMIVTKINGTLQTSVL